MIWFLLRTYLASLFIWTVKCREHLEVSENPIHFMNALIDDKATDNRYNKDDKMMTDVYLSTYDCDLAPSVCPPEVKGTHHPTTCEYTSRRDQQINAINGDTKSDVMCLQGVWYARDLEKIVHEVKKKFEYSYSFLHNKNGTINASTRFPAPCSDKDKPILEIMGECEFTSCYYTSERVKIFKCIEDKCKIKSIMKSMSETCLGCIFQGTKADNFHECLDQKYAFNPTGLLFLSKAPIIEFHRAFFHGMENEEDTNTMYHKSAELVQRGYLDVEVFKIGRIVCTHLTGSLGSTYVEISDDFKSYEEKNRYEFEVLRTLMKNEEKGIVMGNLNASPSLTKGNLAEQFPENLAIMRNLGFEDPVSDSYKTRVADCSYCCGNHLVPRGDMGVCSKYNTKNGYIYDHVLVKGFYVHDTAEDFITNNAVARIFLMDEQHRAISRHYGFRVPILV